MIVENDDEAKSLYDPEKWKIGWYKLHSSYDKNTEPSVTYTMYERRELCVHPEQNYQLGRDKHHMNVVNGTNLEKYTLFSAVSFVENDQPLFKALTQMNSLHNPSVHAFYRSDNGPKFKPADPRGKALSL